MTDPNKAVVLEKWPDFLDYNPETGIFLWKVTRGGKAQAGSVAGSIDTHGYVQIKINGIPTLAHRIAFEMMTGEPAPKQIDHINGLRSDNRWANLRPATQGENSRNSRIRSDNKSGVKGVYWRKETQKWCVLIRANGEKHDLGSFDELAEATRVASKARKELHGDFRRET